MKIYIDLLLQCANETGFDRSSVMHSIEKIKSEYANNNNEVDDRAMHNRLLMLIPHTFHDRLMEKELQYQLDLGDDFNLEDFNP